MLASLGSHEVMSYNIKVKIRKYDQESKVMVTGPIKFTILCGLDVNTKMVATWVCL